MLHQCAYSSSFTTKKGDGDARKNRISELMRTEDFFLRILIKCANLDTVGKH